MQWTEAIWWGVCDLREFCHLTQGMHGLPCPHPQLQARHWAMQRFAGKQEVKCVQMSIPERSEGSTISCIPCTQTFHFYVFKIPMQMTEQLEPSLPRLSKMPCFWYEKWCELVQFVLRVVYDSWRRMLFNNFSPNSLKLLKSDMKPFPTYVVYRS